MLLIVLISVKIRERYHKLKFGCKNYFRSIRFVHEFLDIFVCIFGMYALRPFYPYKIRPFSLRFGHNRILEKMNAKNTLKLARNSGKRLFDPSFAHFLLN